MKSTNMQRKSSLMGALVGFALLASCGRTELFPFVRRAPASDGGTPSDTAAFSGPCRAATCLTTLFRTCVPEGRCAIFGTGGPHTSVGQRCYANGVMVSSQGGWNGKNTYRDLTVRRDRTTCYQISESDPPSGGGAEYVITGAGGKRVATGSAQPETGTITVTCEGGTPTEINEACLQPVGSDDSACEWNVPDWSAACP
jgi:hypothetical protein